MRDISQTPKFISVKHRVSNVLAPSQSCATNNHHLTWEYFHPSWKNPLLVDSRSLLLPSPRQPLIRLLSLWFSHPGHFIWCGITQYVAPCVWLLPLGIMPARIMDFIDVRELHRFYGRIVVHGMDRPHFVFPSSVDGHWVFPLFGYYELHYYKHLCPGYVWM